MHALIKIRPLTKPEIDSFIEEFKSINPKISYEYYINNRLVDAWSEKVNGIRIKLNDKPVFISIKDYAHLYFKNLPEDQHNSILDLVKKSKLAVTPNFDLSIALLIGFCLLESLVLFSAFERSETLGLVLTGSLISMFIGLTMLTTAIFDLKGNPLKIAGIVFYSIGMILLAPASLLTLRLFRELSANQLPKYFDSTPDETEISKTIKQ